MLFVLYTLELLHLCNCGCQIGLPIKQELDRYSKSTIGTGHAFKVLSTSDLWTCLDLCSRFSMCRSVDLNRDQQTCRLNVRSAVEEPGLLMESDDTFHIPKEDFLAIVNDGCLHHSCENMSMCLGGNCVPIFVKKCDSPPVVLNSEGTPPEGPLPIGHTHNYMCSVGYIGFWESYTTCQDNGKWSEVVFQCIDICIVHGNRRIGTWCYFFTTVKATRTNANALCTNRGMYHSRIETSQEWYTLRPHISGSYWISGYAEYTFGLARAFYWLPGFRIGFAPWLPGQPDNALFNQFHIRIAQNGWDDEYKDTKLRVLCEADY